MSTPERILDVAARIAERHNALHPNDIMHAIKHSDGNNDFAYLIPKDSMAALRLWWSGDDTDPQFVCADVVKCRFVEVENWNDAPIKVGWVEPEQHAQSIQNFGALAPVMAHLFATHEPREEDVLPVHGIYKRTE
jgi:hypothetical protein